MNATIQQVLAGMSDAEAVAVWRVLGQAVANDRERDDGETDADHAIAGVVVDRLDAVIAGLAQ